MKITKKQLYGYEDCLELTHESIYGSVLMLYFHNGSGELIIKNSQGQEVLFVDDGLYKHKLEDIEEKIRDLQILKDALRVLKQQNVTRLNDALKNAPYEEIPDIYKYGPRAKKKRIAKKIIINWDPFWGNTSSSEALYEFAEKIISFKEFENSLWTDKCKAETKKLKKLKVSTARRRAKVALRRRGYYS